MARQALDLLLLNFDLSAFGRVVYARFAILEAR